ncbi:MAG: nitrilase-related carbon-nitrogen hydrolase [Candidatus Sericytochromatia bacterium]
MSLLNAAVIQFDPGPDIATNLAEAGQWIAQAAAAGAQLIALQEAFAYRGPHSPDDMARISETLPGPLYQWLSEQARQHGIWLVGGSLFEAIPGDRAHAYNSCLTFDPEGKCVGHYRKIHLFALQSGQQQVSESDYQCAGASDDVVTVPTPWGGLGLSICFDLRFPSLYQHQVRQQGARILAVPSAFLFKTGADHWEVLLRARAIETHCWVLAPNGYSSSGLPTYGRSLIVDPWGNVVARMPDQAGFVQATLDFKLQDQIRARMPVLDQQG